MTGTVLRSLTGRLLGERGTAVVLELPDDEPVMYQDLLDELSNSVDDVEVRSVLGTACTTAARAGDQLIAALQLPYEATRGWQDLLDGLGNRATAMRQIVVVVDASELLKHEDRDRWQELVRSLYGGPYCLGGGWATLVLVDWAFRWRRSMFGSAAAAQEAAYRR